jgi:hypothetical protein
MTESEVLEIASKLFADLDVVNQRKRLLDAEIKRLCHEYDKASRCWGFQPYHLRRACEARGMLELVA